MLPEQQRKQLAATLKKMEQAWESPETIKLYVSAFNKKYSGTTSQPEKSAFMQMAWDIKSGAKAFVGDIKSNITGKPQKEEDKWLLNRTFDVFWQAGKDIKESFSWTTMKDIPWIINPLVVSDQEKKLFTAISKPLTKTPGDVAISWVKTLATDQRVQEVKDLIQSKPVQWTAEHVKKLADIVVPNKTDQEFLIEASNWIPVPIIDDILSGAFRGAKYVPDAGTPIGKAPFAKSGVSPEWALPLGEGLMTGWENLASGIVETAANAGKWIVNTAAERTLTLANPDWRIGKVATRDIKQATGKSPAQYALENGVIDADSAKNLHYSNLEKKNNLIKDFGQTQKDVFSTSMAESLLKQIDDISKEIKITNPEIIKARENLERFINTENPTYAQKDAIKSLYDLQNPDNLKWDIKWKPEAAPKHQEAAFRRWEVQKEIEARGRELGFDVAKINKDIQASYALEKWLRNRAEVLDANTGIGWQDSQLWVLATLAGGLDAGTAAILFKKLLLDNSSFRWQIAKKMYIWANENRTLTSWAGDPPSNRAGRLVNTIGDNPTGNITVPINGKTGVWLAKTFERGYTLKDWQIDKPFGIKEALEDFKKLPLQEQAAAVAESPALARVVEIDEVMTTLPKGLFGSKVPPQEIVASLRPITEKIINKEYTPQELDFISESAPKEAQMELRRAYENTKLTGYKTDTELADAPPKTEQDILKNDLKEVNRIATSPTGRKAVAVSDYFYREFVSGKKDMNEIFNIMDANDMNPDTLGQANIVDGFNRFMRRLDEDRITVADNGTADISRQRVPEETVQKPSEPMKEDKSYRDFRSPEEMERDYLVKNGLTNRQAENALREYGGWFDDPELMSWKIEMLRKSLKNNGKTPDEISFILDKYVDDMNTKWLDAGESMGTDAEMKSLEEQGRGIEMRNPEESIAPEEFIKGKEKFRTAAELQKTQLTTKIMKGLGDRETVSKEFINNMTNQGDVKQVEKELIRELLKWEGDKVNVADFKKKVEAELLPLTVLWDIKKGETLSRYENIALPDDIRWDVADYTERIYESPVKTSVGDIHFGESPMGDEGGIDRYFGHTRIEDMADDTTRRVIEVQSDLYQKGNLEKEGTTQDAFRESPEVIKKRYENSKWFPSEKMFKKQYDEMIAREKDVDKLRQYNDPTAHFRMIREEVAQAVRDGKKKLQFPTGETAMKIEGLGETNNWNFYDNTFRWMRKLEEKYLEVWKEIFDPANRTNWGENRDWIITDVLGDGKFKAVPKKIIDRSNAWGIKEKELNWKKYYEVVNSETGVVDSQEFSREIAEQNLSTRKKSLEYSETFDISGKVDQANPIYKFYEKEMGRYLKNKYNAKLVTDDKWVSWYEVELKPEMGGDVEAFRILGDKLGAKITPEQITEIQKLNTKLFGDDSVDIVPQILSNKDALGSYKDWMIKILDGQAEAKDTYMHEAVHKYLDAFTSEVEHLDVLEAGKKKYKLDDYVEVEERIAEDFIKYAKTRTGVTGTLKLYFDKIIQNIKAFFGSSDKIDSLYADIIAGKAKGAKGKVKDTKMKYDTKKPQK